MVTETGTPPVQMRCPRCSRPADATTTITTRDGRDRVYRCNHCELTFRTHEGYCVQGRFWARDAAGAWIRTDEM